MPANTRGDSQLRAALSVETLEGRAMPSAVAPRPQMIDPGLVHVSAPPQGVYVAGLSVAKQLHNPAAMRVVSRIMVNGELVTRFLGKPQFAALGPSVSCGPDGSIVSGGTTLFANGRKIGAFDVHPTITREVSIHVNRYGVAARVLTFRIEGTPYLPPQSTDVGISCFPIAVG